MKESTTVHWDDMLTDCTKVGTMISMRLFYTILSVVFHSNRKFITPATMTGGTCHQESTMAPWR